MAVTCFRYLGCYEFCEQVERVQHHPELTRLFVANIWDNKVTLVGVTFTFSSSIIVDVTRIPNVGEKWYKEQDPKQNLQYNGQIEECKAKTGSKRKKKRRIGFVCLLNIPCLIRILDDGSAHQFWSSLEEILFFANFENCTHRKSGSTSSATGAVLFLGAPNAQMACIFGFIAMRTCTLWIF